MALTNGTKKLLRTDSLGIGRGAHYHVVYLNEQDGRGVMSFDDDHTHEVIWQPATEPQVDPMGNVLMEGSPAQWVVGPGPDGHTHQFEEVRTKAEKKKEDEEQVVKEVHRLYLEACDAESESLKAAKEADDFYRGEQWEPDVKRRLEGDNRAALTINFTQHYIHKLCGHQRKQRTDIQYAPVGDGDERVADAYSYVAKHVQEQCFFDREESKVFKDAAVPGRGVYNFRISFDRNLQGDILIEHYPWTDIVFGPHDKEDLSDCEYLVKSKMFSLAKLKQLWGDKVEDIEASHEMLMDPTREPTVGYATDNYSHPDRSWPAVMLGSQVLIDIARKNYRVLECWRRTYVKVSVLANSGEEFFFPAHGWSSKDVKKVETMPGFAVIDRTVPKMRITKVAGSRVLSDEDPAKLPIDDFFAVPVYCERRAGRFWGAVELVKDSQRELNKRRSQTVDIGNKIAGAYGWFYDSQTFPDNEKEKAKKNINKPGFFIEVNDSGKLPVQQEGAGFPAGIAELMDMAAQTVAAFLDTTVEDAGANTSNMAILTRQQQKLAGHEELFDNLSFSKRKLGRLLLHAIRAYYSPERIIRILKNRSVREDVNLGGQPLEEFSDAELYQILENAEVADYDVAVVESAWSPTSKMAMFSTLSELMAKGAPIPAEMLIELAPQIPEASKQKMLEQLAAQAEADSQAQQATADAEVEKTLAAKGIFTPRVQSLMSGQSGMAEGFAPEMPPQDPMMGGGMAEGSMVMPTGDAMQGAAQMMNAMPDEQGFDPSMPMPQGSMGDPNTVTPEVVASYAEEQAREERVMAMTQQMLEVVKQIQPPPITINIDNSKPRKTVGQIVTDQEGNKQAVFQDVPDEVVA